MSAQPVTYNASPSGVPVIEKGQVTVDPASLATLTGTDVTVTFAGALVGDDVIVSPAADLSAGIIIASARVSAANTLKIRFFNGSAGTVDQASVILDVAVLHG